VGLFHDPLQEVLIRLIPPALGIALLDHHPPNLPVPLHRHLLPFVQGDFGTTEPPDETNSDANGRSGRSKTCHL